MTRFTAYPSLVLAIGASWAHAAIDVGTCEQFAAVDRRTETEVTITSADFRCGTYTRLSIRADMVLKSTVGKVTFTNLALKVYGSLTVEPDVVFTGVNLVESNGGALKLALGAVTVFKGTADFNGNSVVVTENMSTDDDSFRRFSQAGRKGGAIHNKGNLTFEKDATFVENHNVGSGYGEGGAISVHVKGSVHFMGNLNVTGNSNLIGSDDDQGDGGFSYNIGEGGAVYNLGDIVVDGEADFSGNTGGKGGAIYQDRWATSVFNGFVTFTDNQCTNTHGGAVANFGGELSFEAGSLFFDNFASNSGDGGYGGGIFNRDDGVVTLKGATTFRQNSALWGAGIFSREGGNNVPMIVYPEDTIFEDNMGEFCNDVAFAFDEDTCGL